MEQKNTILVVDDTEINRVILSDILDQEYVIVEATNGREAVDYLRHHHAEIALVLLDIVMPEMDGFEVLAVMNRNGWIQSVPVIMISAEVSSSYIDHAYDLGATDYITRPFDEKTVLRRTHNTVMLYAKQKMLENMVAEQIMEKERSNSQMVEILSNIVEFRNGESGMHVLHIRVITDMLLQCLRRMAPQYNLTSARIALITNASAMHDIGKISIDEKVLNKPGRLTPEEYEIMKQHTVIGAKMLEESNQYSDSELIKTAYEICRWHHERYDGRGYPDGLKGDEIPITAQVVALADVYDALTSERVYKPAFTHEKAMEMILNGECGTFNPLLLDCLKECSLRLSREMKIDSPRSIGMIEAKQAAAELMAHGELRVSGQALSQLEQERLKLRFFLSLTSDALFEYDCSSQTLEFSDRAAEALGLPTMIPHPLEDPTLLAWNGHASQELTALLKKASPSSPMVWGDYNLWLKSGPRDYSIILRALWDDSDSPDYSRVIGILAEPGKSPEWFLATAAKA